VGLTLIVGPANVGKVALLLERYRTALAHGHEPFLIVPNRPDVERVERELLADGGALVGGEIGTFDDLFERVASSATTPVSDLQAMLLLRRIASSTPLNGLSVSARSAGFVDALRDAIRELGGALVAPQSLDGGRSTGASAACTTRTGASSSGSGSQTVASSNRSPSSG
jgi:ATP-dependent helicase/DNAse subunit B